MTLCPEDEVIAIRYLQDIFREYYTLNNAFIIYLSSIKSQFSLVLSLLGQKRLLPKNSLSFPLFRLESQFLLCQADCLIANVDLNQALFAVERAEALQLLDLR